MPTRDPITAPEWSLLVGAAVSFAVAVRAVVALLGVA